MKLLSEKDLEYWLLQLEEFIAYYTPGFWREKIKDVDFPPLITEDELKSICNGKIPDDKKFQKWYVKEAITKWTEKYLLTAKTKCDKLVL